jgi:hypothetical protein
MAVFTRIGNLPEHLASPKSTPEHAGSKIMSRTTNQPHLIIVSQPLSHGKNAIRFTAPPSSYCTNIRIQNNVMR